MLGSIEYRYVKMQVYCAVVVMRKPGADRCHFYSQGDTCNMEEFGLIKQCTVLDRHYKFHDIFILLLLRPKVDSASRNKSSLSPMIGEGNRVNEMAF